MPEFRIHPSWRDPRWRKGLNRLPADQQAILKNSLRSLLEALRDCRDPVLDGKLQAWSPRKWATTKAQSGHGNWVEYYLGDDDNRGRAVVCAKKVGGVIFLVARTAVHDHASMRELVAKFSPDKSIDGEAWS